MRFTRVSLAGVLRRYPAVRVLLVAAFVAAQSAPFGASLAQQAPSPAPPLVAPPESAPAAVDEGLFYFADGQTIGLLRRTDRIAVASTGGDTELIRPGGALDGFSPDAVVTTGVRMFRSPGGSPSPTDMAMQAAATSDAIARLEAEPAVEWAVPVFVDAMAGGTLVATNEVIVALERPVNPEAFFGGDPRFSGYRPLLGTDDQFVATLADGAGEATVLLANELHMAPGVAWAAPNFYRQLARHALPNDPRLVFQWHLHNTGQLGGTVDADVDAPEAWDLGTGSPDVVVAVIDDGMEYTHPDLAANVWVNPGEVAGNGIDDDGNGWIDDVRGWDFSDLGDNDPGPSQPNDEHATAVAGIVAAVGNNALGVTGIAYGSKVMPVRIFRGSEFVGDANAASAIYYAAGRRADGIGSWTSATILNNSWGGGAPASVITSAFTWASTSARGGLGVPSFISTGNDGEGAVSYPARLSATLSGVIAVGASTHRDVRASYSNHGPEVDVVAPSSDGEGVGTTTTDRIGTLGYNRVSSANGGDYTNPIPEITSFGGTSSAAPLAAGIGALVLSQRPALSAAQVRAIIRASTDLIGPVPYLGGFNTEYGYGRVNASRAVRMAMSTTAEIAVFGPTGEVLNGGASGGMSALIGQTQVRSFTVRNLGGSPLTLGRVTVDGGAFTVQSPLSATTLGLGESATFTVAFTPTVSARTTAKVSFSNNDANENPFTFTIEGAGVPVSIAGHVFEDWDGDGRREAGEPGMAGQKVFLDRNNNGTIDGTTFTDDGGVPLVDNGTLRRTLFVLGQVGTIGDLSVRINLTHSWVSDLRIRLISPSGTPVTLFNRRGEAGDNITNAVFDDAAPTPIGSASPPFTGTFRPETPLGVLAGEGLNGTWTLEVTDAVFRDSGLLIDWAITVGNERVARTDASGAYAFLGLPTDTYIVRRQLPPGWTSTSPAGGGYIRPIDDADTQWSGVDFGQVRQGAIYGQQFTDLAGNGVRDEGDPPAGGWTVALDTNNNGLVDLPQSFTSVVRSTIADFAETTFTQVVAGGPSPISDLDVTVNATHTWVRDLAITLVSPSGTEVALINARGGANDNLTGTTFDDEAAVAISSGSAPFTGRFRPETPLSAVDGEDANGTWTLRIRDSAYGDEGTLIDWTLHMTVDRTVTTGPSGNFVFTGLAPGPYSVLQMDQPGYVRTRPRSGLYGIKLNAEDTALAVDFGNVADVTPPTADIIDVMPDPRLSAVASIGVEFSEAVTGVDIGDFTLTRNNVALSLAGVTVGGSGARYLLDGLGALTAAPGTYVLTLRAAGSGIADVAQVPLVDDARDSWVVSANKPRIVGQVVARGLGAATVDVRFTNTGDGTASDVVVDTVGFRTVAGAGLVTLSGPELPTALGTLAPGASVIRTFQLNVPAGVTRFVITEAGSYRTPQGRLNRFSSSQTVRK